MSARCSGSGETGKRRGLKILRLNKAYGFESRLPHQSLPSGKPLAWFQLTRPGPMTGLGLASGSAIGSSCGRCSSPPFFLSCSQPECTSSSGPRLLAVCPLLSSARLPGPAFGSPQQASGAAPGCVDFHKPLTFNGLFLKSKSVLDVCRQAPESALSPAIEATMVVAGRSLSAARQALLA